VQLEVGGVGPEHRLHRTEHQRMRDELLAGRRAGK